MCRTGTETFGYAGMDEFRETIEGREGSFVYQHGGLHDAHASSAFGFIVSHSGTGGLREITGNVEISVTENDEHRITLDYDLP